MIIIDADQVMLHLRTVAHTLAFVGGTAQNAAGPTKPV